MIFIFFQNCVSPHQMPYIKEMANFRKCERICIVVPESDMQSRVDMGWERQLNKAKSSDKIEIIVSPSDNEVKELFSLYTNKGKVFCFFSGITSFESVRKWLDISLKYDVVRNIITEAPLVYNHPLWMHAIRFFMKDFKYVKHIENVFLMGDDFIDYYRFWSRRWQVYPFMYCTEWKSRVRDIADEGNLKILFVGSLSHRKSVRLLLEASKGVENVEIAIVGDGEERQKLESMVRESSLNVHFYGVKQMGEVSEIMQEYDVLVLPSLHDGWGAVVNEALTMGLYVICSDRCGAKYLLKDSLLGSIFKSGDVIDLENRIRDCLKNKSEIRSTTYERIDIARGKIHGKVVAKYLLNKIGIVE